MDSQSELCPDRTAVNVSLLLLRLVVGVIFAAHGAQKVLGVWGGNGLTASVQMFTQMTSSQVLAYLVVFGEFLGGIGLIVGFLTRFSAASLIVIMLGAIRMVHGKNGFFMGQGAPGFEYNLALIGLLLPILICGAGRFSIGRFFLPKSAKTGRPVVVLE